MVSTNDIRPGQSIIVDDVIYQIMEYAHVKPGKGKACLLYTSPSPRD